MSGWLIRISICSVWLVTFQSAAQDFSFQSFEEEFPNRPVNDFLIDNKGFLWIGTFGAGLYRFDGMNYEPYTFDWYDSSSVNSNFIISLEEDHKGRIWIGTDKGLCRYDPVTRKFQRIKIKYDQNPTQEFLSIFSILADDSGNIYLGSSGNGIIRLDSSNTEGNYINATPHYQNINVSDIARDRFDNLFVATNVGLRIFSETNELLETPKIALENRLLQGPIQSIFVIEGTVWVGTEDQGLISIEGYHTFNPEVKHFPITNKRIMDIDRYSDSKVLCATENDGLLVWDMEKNQVSKFIEDPYDKKSVETNSIWAIEVDEDGRLWLGYYNKGMGLYAPDFSKFEHIQHDIYKYNSLKANSVNSLIQDGDSIVWIGMDGGGVDKYMINENQFVHLTPKNGYRGLTNISVQTMLLDKDRNLWVGTWEGGIFFLPEGERKFQNFNTDNSGLRSNRILDLTEDKEGNIWMGTFGAGIHKYILKENKIEQVLSEGIKREWIDKEDIRDVLIDQDGDIWIGSTLGLYEMVIVGKDTLIQNFKTKFSHKDLHPNSNHILSLYEDENKKIWIGTDGAGLFSYHQVTDSLVWHNQVLSLGLNTICAIAKDNQNNLWVTGKSGIAKLNEEEGRVVHYTEKDELTSNNFNYNAILSLPDNVLLFGSLEGINKIKYDEPRIDSTQINAYLDKLKIFNKEVKPGEPESPLTKAFSATDQIVLDAYQSVFTIEYTGINFTRPEQIQFAYYLEGLESDWNYVGDQRSATYTSLKDGSYVFRLKAAKNDGKWSEKHATLKIKILPAWYKSKWALVVYIILFLSGLYTLYTILRMRVRERQEVLNERERRKQDEALTKRKLQFFTNISHEFRTPLTLILNPLAELITMKDLPITANRQLNTVQRNARRLERLVNELMDFRKLNSNKLKIHVHKINLLSFTKEIAKYFQEEAENNEIELMVHGDVENYSAWVDSGLVEKMLFNLLSNAFKVTPEKGFITINLSEVSKLLPLVDHEEIEALKLSVSDTGPGLASDHLEKIFERFYQVEPMNQWYFSGTGIGLEVVKSFIELHKGKVEVESQEGKGTTFHLYFPLGKDHFNEEDIVKGEYPGRKEFLVPDKPSEDASLEEASVIDGRKKSTVLLVDDNVELRRFVKNELKEHYQVEMAKNGQEGLEMALHHLPDVIITDVMMPEMDGFEFCEKIKADIKTSHIPLIMLTAKSTPEDHISGVDKGADAYITKPFDMVLLKAQIKQLLKSRQVLFEKYLNSISDLNSTPDTTMVDRDFMQKILLFIQNHISDSQLSVESIAEEVALSRSQLYRKVKALTGLNVNEFIRRIRLEQAKKLLIQDGDYNINEISYKVGFSSPSYFSKCYKEQYGVLPKSERPLT
ncbi:response regulator [Fulvivirga sp. M361]|uniref:hybrid sensor histidine kinase/response regulator transcription factor n=1 Tax=Fulvivirga sp. M361 TaxID=2594266 RepID=UPI00117B5A49|nr:hybrid sensor histidine kinase/response regulator transcription factor [Fulvivirga sp. M361]TRX50029.1 response regulator [Fulvivirga sp. M361]